MTEFSFLSKSATIYNNQRKALVQFYRGAILPFYHKTVLPSLSKSSVRITLSVLISAGIAGLVSFIIINSSVDSPNEKAVAGVAHYIPKGQTGGVAGDIASMRERADRYDANSRPSIHKEADFYNNTSGKVKEIKDTKSIQAPAQVSEELSRKVSFSSLARNTAKYDTPGYQTISQKGHTVSVTTSPWKLQLILNKSETIKIAEPYATALISSEEIADVVPLSDQLIYILAKKTGTTRLTVLDSNKRIIGIVEIEVTYDLPSIAQELKKLLPKTNITVRSLNGNVLLTGSVPDAVTLKRAITFAERFTASNITNALTVADPQQVMLEVRFLEANKEAARELGIGWNVIANKVVGATLLAANPAGAVTDALSGNTSSGLVSGRQPFGAAVASFISKGASIDVLIQALENRNVARRLAEPNLVALSGDTANFLAGGEFPFSIIGPNQTVGTQFRKFGISLEFTPTVLDNGLINLRIEPEVSEIGPTLVALGNGANAPSLLVRRVKTTVELRDGQSFAIAGLLQSTDTKIRNQLPWIGNIPILGALFRSAAFQRRETDLVIIITPRLVQPAVPTQKLATPLDDTMASNDVEFFIGGKDEVPIKNKNQLEQVGHIIGASTGSGEHRSSSGNDGDAVKTNKAVQTIDPWPKYAKDVDFQVDGIRSMRTLEKYYDGQRTGDEGVKKEEGVSNTQGEATEKRTVDELTKPQ